MKKFSFFVYFLFLIITPFSLKALATVAGVVVDATTNLPISGATVQAIRNNQVAGSTTTNGSGFYTMNVQPGNNYTIVAMASGYQNQNIGANLRNNQTTTVNFSLTPNGGTISGTVINSSTSNPISGATVEIFQGPIFITSDTTDVNGNYSIANLSPGNYSVIASASGFQDGFQGATVNAGATTVVDFALDLIPGTISGTVTDSSTSNPISGAFIEVFKGPISIASTTTDGSGNYTIADLAPDNYIVEATATNYQNQDIGATVISGGITTVDFALDSNPGTISGTVTDSSTSNPIAGALIEVFKGPILIASILTDPDGNYIITDLAPDSYEVEAMANNYQDQMAGAIVTAGGTTTVDFALDSNPGTISGTVTDSSTLNPIAGALIEVFKGPVLIAFDLTDASGNYIITGLAPDSYHVEAMANNYQDQIAVATVTAGAITDVDFALDSNPGTISGTVTDSSTSNPIAGAHIEVFSGSILIACALSDPNGDYIITGLAPDTYNVEAMATNYQEQVKEAVVTAGNTTVVDFDLDSNPGTISGNVNDTITNISGAIVEVFDNDILLAFSLTDADGNYQITGLAPGSYQIKVLANKYQDQTQNASITAGNTTNLNFILVPEILPPSSISGAIVKHLCLTQIDLIHAIYWSSSDSLYITQYQISRNGVVIAAILSNNVLEFLDHRRNSQKDTYTLVAINQFGQISSALTITLD